MRIDACIQVARMGQAGAGAVNPVHIRKPEVCPERVYNGQRGGKRQLERRTPTHPPTRHVAVN